MIFRLTMDAHADGWSFLVKTQNIKQAKIVMFVQPVRWKQV